MDQEYIQGRGAQFNPDNPFHSQNQIIRYPEGIDEFVHDNPKTEIYIEHPKQIISKNESPDIPFTYSINPYQGCEHGCIYCYARNVHQYWGWSAGLDWETKIIIKPEAPRMLESIFLKSSWKPETIVMSGNTDCYQPLERKLKITRDLLKVFAKYRNPVGLITKNSLITRDLDLLSDLAKDNLVKVFFSITTLDETLRRIMEPRTSNAFKLMEAIKKLSEHQIPVGVMCGPVIPSLNDHEITPILKMAAEKGAVSAGFTIARFNGSIADLFEDWIKKNFPERADKILHKIRDMHGGNLNDSRWGRRMRGEGKYAEMIHKVFDAARKKYFKNRQMPEYDFSKFRRGGNFNLFG